MAATRSLRRRLLLLLTALLWTEVLPSALSAAAQPGPREAESRVPPTTTVDLGDGVTMDFVLIEPGSFLMGTETHEFDEAPVHKVTLTRPFYLGKYEVTQRQWEKIMGSNPSHFRGAQRPVENVSWNDCQRFIETLQKKSRRRFALPTEAQWEYACRAGSGAEYSHGNNEDGLGEYAWYASNAELTTHPVGVRRPNAWGLHDMHGNVYEWCADWYSEGPYAKGEAADPAGPAQGRRRVLRGGGWIFVADNLRSADRGFSPPDLRTNEYGFRCVLFPEDQTLSLAAARIAEDTGTGSTSASKPSEPEEAAVEQAIADADRLRAEFLLAAFETRHVADERIRQWKQRIGVLPSPSKTVTLSLANGVAMDFILIPPGTFVMGSDDAESAHEKPAHTVTITHPFYIGKYEVTQRQWEALMSRNESVFRDEPTNPGMENRPVDTVNWDLAGSFLGKLNQSFPECGFRLPTEAEWEYACRAGSTGQRHFVAGSLSDYAWYGENAGGQTHPVGQKKPNAWGLHDMYGNVWEWCEDRFGEYQGGAVVDPVGPLVAQFAGARVARGGAWNNLGKYVNSTFRHDAIASVMARYYGFRCVASVKLAEKAQKP